MRGLYAAAFALQAPAHWLLGQEGLQISPGKFSHPLPTLSRYTYSRSHPSGHKLQVQVSTGRVGWSGVGGGLRDPVFYLPSTPIYGRDN